MGFLDILNPDNAKTSAELAAEAVQQYVVRPTGAPNNTIGVSGYVFHILDDEEMNFDSEITDHFVEANYAIQDHIALRSPRFTLRGFVAEISYDAPNYFSIATALVDRIGSVGQYSPGFVTQAEQVYDSVVNAINLNNKAIEGVASAYNLFSLKSTTANKQQDAFNYFYSMWLSRQLCTVETPWQIFTNMAIESVRAIQRGDTRHVTDFSVRFKQIRQVVQISIVNPVAAAGRALNMFASLPDSGSLVNGDNANITVSDQAFFKQ